MIIIAINISIPANLQNVEPVEYKFLLHSPNGMPINPIEGVFDLTAEFSMEKVSSLVFYVSKYITRYHKTVENPLWDYLECPFLITLNDEMTFRIAEASLSVEDDGSAAKEIKAYSLEDEMSAKTVRNFKSTINGEAQPRQIRDLVEEFLNEHMNGSWKITSIDADVESRYRLVPDTDEKTLLDFFKDVQTAYSCLFKYITSIDPDTRLPRRDIEIYDSTIYKKCPKCGADIVYFDGALSCTACDWTKPIYGEDSGIVITDRNYIKTYSERFENPVTRLYVKGANDLDIILANPTGQEYIDDLSYYRNSKFMSYDLLDALDRYDRVVEDNIDEIEETRKALNDATIKKSVLLYGNIEGISKDIAMVEGWLDKANECFNKWYADGANNSDKLTEANELLDIVDGWFKGETVKVNEEEITRESWCYYDDEKGILRTTYGIENLQRLYNVYDERISIIGQLNDKLEYVCNKDGKYLLQNIPDTTSLDTRFEGINVENLTAIRDEISKAISDLEKILSETESDIEEYQNKLDELRKNISTAYAEDDKGIIFDDELIKELNLFIIEGTYTNDTIGTSADIGSEEYLKMCQELYDDGQKAFVGKREPVVTIETDVIDFLSCCNCVMDKASFNIGNLIHVHHTESYDKKNDYANMTFRLVGYKHSPSINRLYITVSNAERFVSRYTATGNMLKNGATASSIVSFNKGNWNNAKQNAVDTIINDGLNTAKTTIQCADHQRSVMDNRGITMGSYVESESDKQVRLMNTGLYITNNNWSTVNTAVTGNGIIADRLIGRQLIGSNLKLQASGENKTVYANFDSTGFSIANGNFSVGNLKTDGSGTVDFDGNGFFVDPNNGVVVRGSTKDENDKNQTYEVRLNPNPNISKIIEVVRTKGGDKEYLYFDKDSEEFVVNGNVYCKSLYLDEKGGKNVVDIIEEATDSNKPYGDRKNKISGNYIEGRGLKAYDESGSLRVSIDGNNGSLTMIDGKIKMYNGNNNSLFIDPDNFIQWILKGEKKFYYDGYKNAIVFGGNIDTKEDVVIGRQLKMCNYNNDGYILFGDNASIHGNKNTDTLIISAMHGISLNCASGEVTIDGMDVKDEIELLKANLNAVAQRLNAHINAG